jgi:drug/metabolite transporter (DMT)-like permease
VLTALGYIGLYVLLIGVASFLESPVGSGFSPFQLNALIRVGSLAAALAAVFAVDGLAVPPLPWVLAALGVGLISGLGSICYCLSLNSMPVSLVVTLANLYLVVTVALAAAVLHDPLTLFTIAGLVCTLAGMLILVHPPGKYGVQSAPTSGPNMPSLRAYGTMGLYVLLVGAGSFLEKPILGAMDATQLNALLSITMTAVAGVTLAVMGPPLPGKGGTLLAVGLGAMIGVGSVFYFLGLGGLPVSVASALSNTSMAVTVILSTIVLRQPLTAMRGGAMALMLGGVTLLALSP